MRSTEPRWTVAPEPRRRLAVRLYNAVASTGRPKPVAPLALARAAGVELDPSRDLGSQLPEGFRLLVDELNRDRNLHPFGRWFLLGSYVARLAQRAAIVRHAARRPELAARPIPAPVLLTGCPRTGSTLLHRLLALDDRLRAPLWWEIERPLVARLAPQAFAPGLALQLLFHLAPDLRVMHPITARSAEECYPFLERAFVCPMFALAADVPRYLDWLWHLNDPDVADAYRFYRLQLAILQRPEPRRWVLKAPAHLPFVPAFLDVFPDARVIVTHRDPRAVVSSLASMVMAFRGITHRSADPRACGAIAAQQLGVFVSRYLETRRRLPNAPMLDVQYAELTARPVATMERVYNFLGLSVDAALERRIERFVDDTTRRHSGRHHYATQQFGLGDDAFGGAYLRYREFLAELPRAA